jgi:hypothetical protein
MRAKKKELAAESREALSLEIISNSNSNSNNKELTNKG